MKPVRIDEIGIIAAKAFTFFILALASFGIYKKYYTLKGEKMEEITRKVNEMHAKKQTA